MKDFFGTFDIWQVLSSFIFLFAIIDPLGNIPVTLNMERKGVRIDALKVCIATIVILLAFLFAGEWVLKLFGVKIEYFAIAGGFVILLMALEMVLDVTIFKNEGLDGSGSIVPLAFPMYAGPGAFTALLSITAEYDIINLVLSVALNTLTLFAVLKGTKWLNKYLGQTSLYILRKFFGIIVLAIACKLMFANLAMVFAGDKTASEIVERTYSSSQNIDDCSDTITCIEINDIEDNKDSVTSYTDLAQ